MKNIANYISISRIIMAVCLLAIKTHTVTFYVIYTYCGLSDILDGYIARKYNIESKIGSQLDSTADMVFAFVYLLKILPIMNLPIWVYMCIIIISGIKIYSLIYGYIHQRQLLFQHTTANKIMGFLIFIAPLIMQYINLDIFEVLVCALAFFSAIQDGYYIRKTARENNL